MKQFGDVELDDDSCYDYVERLRSCEIPNENLDRVNPDLSGDCIDFVEHDITYTGCVANHKNDPLFARGNWRIYLEENTPLWREKREVVRLLDTNGNTIDLYEY